MDCEDACDVINPRGTWLPEFRTTSSLLVATKRLITKRSKDSSST